MSGSSYYNASSTKGNFQGAEDAADLRPVPTNRSDSDRGA